MKRKITRRLVLAALGVLVSFAGIEYEVAAAEGAEAEATAEYTTRELWAGATLHQKSDNSEIWIEGTDLGDPTSKKPEPLDFNIKLVPLTIEHVSHLNGEVRGGFLEAVMGRARFLKGFLEKLGDGIGRGHVKGYAIVYTINYDNTKSAAFAGESNF